MVKTLLICLVVLMLSASAALGLINVPSDGSDGAFNPTVDVEVDLSTASTGTSGTWGQPWLQPGNGHGVYDADKWAVVFKYSSVNIPSGVTVTFKNHPSRAPVVWLVQGNVTIAGTVKLDGQNCVRADPAGLVRFLAQPGPGGFRSGATRVTVQPSGGYGLGPGGGDRGGEYGYGNPGVLPALGGSGASAHPDYSGGGGGGATLIAAGDTVSLTGSISANGGSGHLDWPNSSGGSGGGVRLVADTLHGSGSLFAQGGASGIGVGGPGRVRIEVNVSDFTVTSDPWYTYAPAGTDPDIWLPADKPRVKVVSLGGLTAPADPQAGLTYDSIDFYLAPCSIPRTIVIQADNVPLTWKVRVRVCPTNRTPATWVDAQLQPGGNQALSTWQADLTLSEWYTVIQVRASET